MEKLSITVTDEHAEAIRNRLASGEYASTSEVVRAALRSLDKEEQAHRERIQGIRRRVRDSIEDPRRTLSHEELGKRIGAMTRLDRES